MRLRSSLPAVVVLTLASTFGPLAGCSEDSSDPSGPGGGSFTGTDSVALELHTFDGEGGEARLRWVGSPEGPLPSSPEGTEVPWVGFGVPFEMRWTVTSDSGRVEQYRWKASQAPGAPWVPAEEGGDPVWASATTLEFANDRDPDTLEGENCPDGADCPSIRRWAGISPMPFRFQLEARDESGTVQHFEFGFQVNYPPDTRFLEGARPDGFDPPEYPRFWYFDGQGGWSVTSFSEGDTIPSGSYAVFAVGAEDRFASVSESDSFCCDLPSTPEAENLERQWRFLASDVSDLGSLQELNSQWSVAARDDTLGFFVGPFDYSTRARSRDEHGRIDREEDELSFVAGFPPRVTSVLPEEGMLAVLGPDGSWPETTLPVQTFTSVTRYWDPDLDRFSSDFVEGSESVRGTLHLLPLRFESAADSRQHGVPEASGSSGFGGEVQSWSYRYQSEFDPENRINEGPGDGDLRFFVSAGPDGNFEPEEPVELFVPGIFWDNPDLYDPDGDCPLPELCDQGEYIRRSLGRIELTVVAKSTRSTSSFAWYPSSVRPESAAGQVVKDLSGLGRRSSEERVHFEIWLGLEQDGSSEPLRWPPVSAQR